MIENEDEQVKEFVVNYMTSQWVIAKSNLAEKDAENFVVSLVEEIDRINAPMLMTSRGLLEASKIVFSNVNYTDMILNMYEAFRLRFRYDEESKSVPGLNHEKVAQRIEVALCYTPDFAEDLSFGEIPLFPPSVRAGIQELTDKEKHRAFKASVRWLLPLVMIKMHSVTLLTMIAENQ